jgi:hypothetical protein
LWLRVAVAVVAVKVLAEEVVQEDSELVLVFP